LKSFKNVFIAHYKQFVRDRAALFFTFIFPVMFILIFGWAFNDPGVEVFDVGLVDQGSPRSTNYIYEALQNVVVDGDGVFDVDPGELDERLQSLRDGDLDAVIVVPEDMDVLLDDKRPVALQLYYDPSQVSNQQILVPILNQVVDGIDRGMQGTAQTEVHRLSGARHTGYVADVHRGFRRYSNHTAAAGPDNQTAGRNTVAPLYAYIW